MPKYQIPQEWCFTTLGEVVELKYGKSLPATKRDGGSFPVYGSNGVVGNHSEPLVKTEGIIIGRKGSYGEIQLSHSPFFPIDTTYYVDDFYEQPLKYWFYQLKLLPLTELNRSTAIPGLNREDAYSQVIHLPPLAEQKVIADKLDTLLAQVETTKARLERIPEILKTFRQSVLAAAVSGQLTEEWRGKISCGSAFDYLKTIENERIKLVNAKRLKKSTLPKTAIEQGDSGLPKSWVLVNFEHIAAYDNHALKAGPFGSALKKSDCTDSGYRVYGQEQVIAGDESLVTYYINESKFDDLSSCAVDAGDILVSLVGTIGKVLILSEDAERGIINPRLVKLSLQPEVNQKYIQYFLQSTVALDFFKGFSHGGTMDILNLGILKDLPINFPPTEEQTEIVRRVEELFAFADVIEQKAKDALDRVNKFSQSILAKAFRGELTADWRAANPELISGENSAEALLERIKAEREALKSKPKPKRTTVKKKSGSRMSKKVIKVADALKQAGKPLTGQQLLVEAGYPSDSSTEQLEQFFLDIRKALTVDKSIVQLERQKNGQDVFALAAKEETNEAPR